MSEKLFDEALTVVVHELDENKVIAKNNYVLYKKDVIGDFILELCREESMQPGEPMYSVWVTEYEPGVFEKIEVGHANYHFIQPLLALNHYNKELEALVKKYS